MGKFPKDLEGRWQSAIAQLRRWSRIPLMPRWDVRDIAGNRSAWIEEKRQIWMWPRGQQEQRLILEWSVPEFLYDLPVAGGTLRLKLAWWADWAEIWIDGTRVYEGDLFDRDCRLLLAKNTPSERGFQFELRLRSPAHDDGALQTSHIEIEYPERACDPGRLADELAVFGHCRELWKEEWDAEEWLGRFHRLLEGSIGDRVWEDLAALRRELLPLGDALKQRRVMLLGNAHIDVAWLWPIAETQEVVRRTFESVLNLQQQFSGMTFNQSTALSYRWIEERHPALFERLKRAVAEGRWEVTGGMWVEPDCNLPAGESLVRQILYGKQYLQRLCERQIRVAWNPDSFGFCWQLPQILRKSEFEIFITQKLAWNDRNPFPHQMFWWQGLDGSRILTYFTNEIGQGIDPEAIARYSSQLANQHELSETVWLYGVGDHGGGPTADMLNLAASWEKNELFFTLESGTMDGFLDRLQQSLPHLNVPVWTDELYLELHRGTYTTKGDRKRKNRQLEVLLGTAEILRTIAAIEWGLDYPLAELTTAWQTVLTNQFHDILPGTAIPDVFADADLADAEVREVCEREIALALVGNAPSDEITIWNVLNWKRSQLVCVSAMADIAAIRDLQTDWLLPVQPIEAAVLFPAHVPSLGSARYQLLRSADTVNVATDLVVDRDRLENSHVRINLDPSTGDILQILDKRSQRQLLSAPARLQCFDDRGQYWDAWNIDPNYESKPLHEFSLQSLDIVETGPLRAAICIVRKFRRSTIAQTLKLETGNPQLVIHTQLDWQDTHTLLKAAFPLNFTAPTTTYEIPYGAIARSTFGDNPMDAAKWEVPALRWADMSADGIGLAVLNDCKYGYDAKPDCLRLTLLKSPTWPHPTSDIGQHEFTYSLVPHAGSWQQADIVRRGYELNYPLRVSPGARSLPSNAMAIDADNIVLAAFKQSEDERAWIVRLYEAHGEAVRTTVQMRWAIASLQLCNLLERESETHPFIGNQFCCHFEPFEIQTYRIQLKSP